MSGPTDCNECELPRARFSTHRHICRCNYDADDIREVLSEAEKEADEAEAEVTRLRAALAVIRDLQTAHPVLDAYAARCAIERARAALGTES